MVHKQKKIKSIEQDTEMIQIIKQCRIKQLPSICSICARRQRDRSFPRVATHCPNNLLPFSARVRAAWRRENVQPLSSLFVWDPPLSCALVSWGRELTAKLACISPISPKTVSLCTLSVWEETNYPPSFLPFLKLKYNS